MALEPEEAKAALVEKAIAHWRLLQRRRQGELKVSAYTPTLEEHGWRSTHSVVEIVTDDMPFLVDSLAMALVEHLERILYLVDELGGRNGDPGDKHRADDQTDRGELFAGLSG
jgi:glutamate dehydrogenase